VSDSITAPMTDEEKLRVLLSHWIDHNHEHAGQFRRHAPKAGQAAGEIIAAADAMLLVNVHLQTALKLLGGSVPRPHSH